MTTKTARVGRPPKQQTNNSHAAASPSGSVGKGRSNSSSDSSQGSAASRKDQPGRWNEEEHMLFLQGLEIFGKSWKKISQIVKTRTVVQIRTHAQKYLIKSEKAKRLGLGGQVLMDGKAVTSRKRDPNRASAAAKGGVNGAGAAAAAAGNTSNGDDSIESNTNAYSSSKTSNNNNGNNTFAANVAANMHPNGLAVQPWAMNTFSAPQGFPAFFPGMNMTTHNAASLMPMGHLIATNNNRRGGEPASHQPTTIIFQTSAICQTSPSSAHGNHYSMVGPSGLHHHHHQYNNDSSPHSDAGYTLPSSSSSSSSSSSTGSPASPLSAGVVSGPSSPQHQLNQSHLDVEDLAVFLSRARGGAGHNGGYEFDEATNESLNRWLDHGLLENEVPHIEHSPRAMNKRPRIATDTTGHQQQHHPSHHHPTYPPFFDKMNIYLKNSNRGSGREGHHMMIMGPGAGGMGGLHGSVQSLSAAGGEMLVAAAAVHPLSTSPSNSNSSIMTPPSSSTPQSVSPLGTEGLNASISNYEAMHVVFPAVPTPAHQPTAGAEENLNLFQGFIWDDNIDDAAAASASQA